MCLYSRLIRNPKYKPNKKNGWQAPPVPDVRVAATPIKCGKCIECKKQLGREWQLRMLEDIKTHTNGKFVTLTFSNESIKELTKKCNQKTLDKIDEIRPNKGVYEPHIRKEIDRLRQRTYGYGLDNEIATYAVRHFFENIRDKYKKPCRHWLITELGHQGTENIHLHGILWTNLTIEQIREKWIYGFMWPRNQELDSRKPPKYGKYYVNAKTVNYIIKYITKMDFDHKYYKPKIFTSPGIGGNYTNTLNSKRNTYNGFHTKETYKTDSGHEIAMPIYWRNKIYSETEREALWLMKLDKQKRYVCGEEIDISATETNYYKLLEYHQKRNAALGYGSNKIEWSREQYEQQRRILLHSQRTKTS